MRHCINEQSGSAGFSNSNRRDSRRGRGTQSCSIDVWSCASERACTLWPDRYIKYLKFGMPQRVVSIERKDEKRGGGDVKGPNCAKREGYSSNQRTRRSKQGKRPCNASKEQISMYSSRSCPRLGLNDAGMIGIIPSALRTARRIGLKMLRLISVKSCSIISMSRGCRGSRRNKISKSTIRSLCSNISSSILHEAVTDIASRLSKIH
jgi:hypothetical protein